MVKAEAAGVGPFDFRISQTLANHLFGPELVVGSFFLFPLAGDADGLVVINRKDPLLPGFDAAIASRAGSRTRQGFFPGIGHILLLI
jgi:hypothetical protein